MKLSQWNSYIELEGTSGLIYNAMTDMYIAVKNTADDFQNARQGIVDSLSTEFLKQMKQAGAIVDDGKDEVSEVANLIKDTDSDTSQYQLIINPTLDCNFHCWYCYENHIKDSEMSESTQTGIINFVRNLISGENNLKTFHLSFFGGEPLLKFNKTVKPLIEAVNDLLRDVGIALSVGFTTNGYLLTQPMIDFLSEYDTSFQITLDGGRENHNNTRFQKGAEASFDVILNNIRTLADNGLHVNLRINYTSKNVESTQEIINIVKQWPHRCKENLVVDYQRVWQDHPDSVIDETYSKVKKLRDSLNDSGIRTANNQVFDYVRDSCYADKDYEMLVNFNGDIFSCTARDFKSENRLGRIAEDGSIDYIGNRMELLKNARFKKPICHTCRIAPICGGGCRTKCLENAHTKDCNLGYSSEDIDELILERFEERFMHD